MRRIAAALRAHPQVAIALLAAALVVGLTRAAGPLFAVASRDAALADALETLGPLDAGLEIGMFGFALPERYPAADATLRAAVADRLPALGEGDAALLSRPLEVVGPGAGNPRVRFLARTGAAENIELLEGDASGAVVPGRLAGPLGVGPGDVLQVRANRLGRPVEITGVYRDITDPVPQYWVPMRFQFIPDRPPPLGVAPPPVVLLPEADYLALVSDLRDQTTMTWWFPFPADELAYDDAVALTAGYDGLDRALRDDDDPVGAALSHLRTFGGSASLHSLLPGVVDEIRDAAVALAASTDLLTIAAQVLALLVVGVAGVFTVRARRAEARRAWAQGDSPLRFGLRLTVEAAAPVLVGAVLGGAAAALLIDRAGPGDGLAPEPVRGALVAAGVSGLIALVLLWAVTAAAASGEFRQEPGAVRRTLARVPWELVPVVLAGALLYELLSRGSAVIEQDGGAARVDPLLVAFPFLALVAVAAVGARLVGAVLPRLARGGRRLPTAPFLAVRRLAAAGGLALALTGTVAAAIGLAVYAVTVRASLETTLQQKAAVAVGAPVTVRVAAIDAEQVAGLGIPASAVLRTEAETAPDGDPILLVGLDPATFADVALLPGELASVRERTRQLDWDGEGPVPALLGRGVSADEVDTTHYPLQLQPVGRVPSFPREDPELGLVVVDADAMLAGAEMASVPVRIQHVTEVWTTAEPARASEAIAGAGVLPLEVDTAAAFAERPALRGLTQTFVLLEALGILAVALALTGLVLYLRARQEETEVGYVLARRMGLRPAAHGSAIALEVSGLLVLAGTIGLGAGIALAWLLHARLDPLPTFAPAAQLELPWFVIGVGGGALVAAVLLAAAVVQLAAERVDPSTVLRHAG